MEWFKKFADEIVEQSQPAPNSKQLQFMYDQKQLSLPITPETPVMPEPEPEAPVSEPYNPNQLGLPATEPVQCSAKYCDNSSFNPNNDPSFIIDPVDDNPYCSEHFNKCTECSDYFSTDHLTKHNGNILCNNCYRENVHTCLNCSEEVEEDDLLPPTRRNSRYSMPHGGCTNCAEKCYSCDKVLAKEGDGTYNHDGDYYCEDCFSEAFGTCENCGDTRDRESMRYVENVGEFCEHCYDKEYTRCYKCEEEIEKSDAHEANGEDYCETCFTEIGPAQFANFTEKFEGFTFTKKDKYLDELHDLLPISVKELKAKNPRLADGLRDLITFSKGKTLDTELVSKYRDSLGKEDFPVDYTAWAGIQRSIDNLRGNDLPDAQLVINVKASDKMMAELKADPALYDLFTGINNVSRESSHPTVDDQIGWARLELDPKGQYILVDEIQTDHANAAFKLKSDRASGDLANVRHGLMSKYNLDKDGLDKLLDKLHGLVKDFPDIATKAISQFAKQNDFKKLYWHTYESGKALKRNEPPRSLYEKTPKNNFFQPTEEKPFGLDGKFFERKADDVTGVVARKLMLKYAGKLPS